LISKSQIKHLRSLNQLKFRREFRQFLAEGPKIVSELPGSGIRVEAVYGLREWVEENLAMLDQLKTEIVPVSTNELSRISSLNSPNQAVALCQIPSREISEMDDAGLILALDGIRDPGNLGTIIRTADWFGIHSIICSNDCVDLYNPKTIQATMGSFMRVKVYYTSLPEYLSTCNQEIFATVMDGKSLWDIKTQQGVFLIGNESNGIRPEVMQRATQHISIPSSGKAESLNAAIAAGIVMAHLQRGVGA
jgi:TrmH family RNA methyltransferase